MPSQANCIANQRYHSADHNAIACQPYPKEIAPKIGTGFSSSQYIQIERPGGIVEKRIDELCQNVFGRKFYNDSGVFGKNLQDKPKELIAAQRVQESLSTHLSPLEPLLVKS
jgi:hypothetical protein